MADVFRPRRSMIGIWREGDAANPDYPEAFFVREVQSILGDRLPEGETITLQSLDCPECGRWLMDVCGDFRVYCSGCGKRWLKQMFQQPLAMSASDIVPKVDPRLIKTAEQYHHFLTLSCSPNAAARKQYAAHMEERCCPSCRRWLCAADRLAIGHNYCRPCKKHWLGLPKRDGYSAFIPCPAFLLPPRKDTPHARP